MKRKFIFIFILFACFLGQSCAGGDDDDDNDFDDDNANDDSDDDLNDDSANDDSDDDSDDDIDYPDYPNDDVLRVNHLQCKGTHNSYHVQSPGWAHPEWRYTHQPLDIQLDLGVRKFELDVHYRPGENLHVFHIPVLDRRTTCEYLIDCLATVKQWSDAHPGHHPIIFFLETKGAFDLAGRHAQVEEEILMVWPRERILTPDDVRGEFTTLREAIIEQGWPTLGEARDKIILHAHDHREFRKHYLEGHPSLEGRLMFTDSSVDDPFAGIIVKNDPEGGFNEIQEIIAAGFLVRTRADGCCDEALNNDRERMETAFASGAHMISTDFPAPVDGFDYWVDIPFGTPSRCNPLTAPDFCVSEDIEDLGESK